MSVTEEKLGTHAEDEIEIRLSDVVKFLKSSRRVIVICTLLFLVLGILYAFSKQNQYTATIRVMPELKGASASGGLGDLKSLAGLAGVNLDNAGSPDAIRPDLYPDIVQSIPFTLFLLSRPVVEINKGKPYPLQQFMLDQSKNSLVSKLFSSQEEEAALVIAPKDNATLRLTPTQEGLSKQLNQRIKAEIDKKSGIITITSLMPDPAVAATVAQQTLNYLANYVTNYRTSKARNQVQFLDKQISQAKQRYQTAELNLSSYRDRNRSLFLNTAKIEEQRLQAEYLLTQSVYNDLSKQLEQARIKVQEEAPVFQVLEPARVPLRKSGPNRLAIIIGFTLVGAILSLIVQFVRRLLGQLQN